MHRRHRRTPLVLLIAAMVITWPRSPALAAPAAAGTATTTNTILKVDVADRSVEAGVDLAEARRGSQRHARATYVAGRSGTTTVGGLERAGTDDRDSGRNEAATGTLSLPGVASLRLLAASTGVDLSPARVGSVATSQLADVALADGLLSLDGLVTTTEAQLTDVASTAIRTMTVDGLELFDGDELLEALGIDRFALPCDSIEALGAALGVDAAGACAEVNATVRALRDARRDLARAAEELDDTTAGFGEGAVRADREAASALTCVPADLVCITSALTQLTASAAEYGVTLSDPTDLSTTRAEVVAALDRLLASFADGEVIDDAIAGAAADTCAATLKALGAARRALSDEDPAGLDAVLAAARAQVDAACDASRDTLDEVLGMPMLTIDDVRIEMIAHAAPGGSSGTVGLSIGSIRVGAKDPVTVVDVAETLRVADDLADQLADAIATIDPDAPAPEVELFAIETDERQEGDDTWSAAVSLALLTVRQPAGPFTVPDEPPYGFLGGSAGGGSAGAMLGALAAPRALLAATVDAPAVVVRAVVFDAAAVYSSSPAGAAGPGPFDPPPGSPGGPSAQPGTPPAGSHPVTGVVDLSSLASLMMISAAATRRFLWQQ